MRIQWSGDVDLADGALQKAYEAYKDRLKFIEKLGLGERFGRPALIRDLAKAKDGLAGDLAFISKGTI